MTYYIFHQFYPFFSRHTTRIGHSKPQISHSRLLEHITLIIHRGSPPVAMAGTRPSAAKTSIPPSIPLSSTRGDPQRPGHWDSWHPNLDKRPDLSRFARYNLRPENVEDIQKFFKYRSAYLDMELHPTAHHPKEIRTNAARYLSELELTDDMPNSRAKVLGEKLSELATRQISYIRYIFDKRPAVEEAEKLYASVVRNGRLSLESLTEVLKSGAFPREQLALGATAKNLARTGEAGQEWTAFTNMIVQRRLYLTVMSGRAKDAEEYALMTWWEIVLMR